MRERVYRHPDVLAIAGEAQAALETMFDGYVGRAASCCPSDFAAGPHTAGLRRTVGDYLAGMTDRYARREFERLFRRWRRFSR